MRVADVGKTSMCQNKLHFGNIAELDLINHNWQGTQMSSAVMSFYVFLPFSFIMSPNELCVVSHTGITASAETSVVNCVGFYPKKSSIRQELFCR